MFYDLYLRVCVCEIALTYIGKKYVFLLASSSLMEFFWSSWLNPHWPHSVLKSRQKIDEFVKVGRSFVVLRIFFKRFFSQKALGFSGRKVLLSREFCISRAFLYVESLNSGF